MQNEPTTLAQALMYNLPFFAFILFGVIFLYICVAVKKARTAWRMKKH